MCEQRWEESRCGSHLLLEASQQGHVAGVPQARQRAGGAEAGVLMRPTS